MGVPFDFLAARAIKLDADRSEQTGRSKGNPVSVLRDT